jgi:hypothetical protein
MSIKELGLEGEYRHLDTSIRPEDSKATSVMSLEATVDVKPQELKKIKPFTALRLSAPVGLKFEAQLVLDTLFACFSKQGHVQEGLIGDLVWGFAQADSDIPLPPALTVAGLAELEKLGYIKFQAKDNSWTNMQNDNIETAWVRYQSKLLDLVYEGA